MQVKGIGVSLPVDETVNQIERLRAKLSKVKEIGFTAVELPIQAMEVVINGSLDRSKLATYTALFREYDLRVSAHAPFDINLFRPEGASQDTEALHAVLEAAAAIGAETVVYHPARYVPEEQFLYPAHWPVYTADDRLRLLEQERVALYECGERAKRLGIRIAMENMRPYLDCPGYCYAELPSELVQQIQRIGHSHVGAALDFGHLHLAVAMYGLSWREELALMAPHIIHLHIHDNFGKACYSTEKNQYELLLLGRGDMHAPIGLGNVPYGEIMRVLETGFNGLAIHEVRSRYESSWPDMLRRTFAYREAADNVHAAG